MVIDREALRNIVSPKMVKKPDLKEHKYNDTQ